MKMHNVPWAVTGICLALGASLAASAAPIVVNPSFELGPWSLDTNLASGAPYGWTKTGNRVGVYGTSPAMGPGVPAAIKVPSIPDGTHAAYLWSSNGTPALLQTINGFEVGKQYILSYRENYRTDNSDVANTGMGVKLTSTGGVEGNLISTWHGLTYKSDGWYERNITFTATTTSALLKFVLWTSTPNETGTGAEAIDNVSISLVPEPVSLALLGLGALTLFRRRR